MLNPQTKSLEMIYLKEVKNGKEYFETRRYRNLKTDADDASILEITDAISALSDSPVRSVMVTVQSEVIGG